MFRSRDRAYTTSSDRGIYIIKLRNVRVSLPHHVLLGRLVLGAERPVHLGLLLFPQACAHGAAARLAAANLGYLSVPRRRPRGNFAAPGLVTNCGERWRGGKRLRQ